jgi:quercetin dioxygenase-like cupin family protein
MPFAQNPEDIMNGRNGGIACMAGMAMILITGCQAEPPNEPGELAAASVAPPVTGVPAFTWTFDDPDVPWGPCPEWMPESCELAVIQALDESGRNADALLKMEPGTTVPEHWHTSAERMVLLAGVLQFDYDGQDPLTMTPGIYLYGPAKLPHETHCLGEPGDDACILFIAFEEPVDAIEGAPPQIPDAEAFAWSADDPAVPWSPCFAWMPEGCALAVIQGDPEAPNADVFFKLPPDSRVPMHWHTSVERMVLLSGELRVNYQGQAPVIMDPFTYAYGPAGLPHDTRCGDRGECILFIAFEDIVDAIDVRGDDVPHRP